MNRTELYKRQAEELVSKMTVAEQASQLRYDAPAIPRLGIPAYNWWNDDYMVWQEQALPRCFHKPSLWQQPLMRNW